MNIQFNNTASYEGELIIDGVEMLVTLENGDIVLEHKKMPAPRPTLGILVAERLAPVLFAIMQAEAVVGEENCDVFPPRLSQIALGNERREVEHKLNTEY